MRIPLRFCIAAALLLSACATTGGAEQTSKPAGSSASSPAPAQESQTREAGQAKMPAGTNINSDAKLMAVFRAKVDDYLKLRKSVEGKAGSQVKSTDNPQQLLNSEKALAAQVRAARPNAQRGDFFTPATEAQFRRLMTPAMHGSDGPENKVAIKDDAPEPKDVPFKVNADYPRHEALSTVPPDVLRMLPELPPEIQYRFVGRHLILYDSKANLIIDFMLNALPPLPVVEKK
jgi:hypothetical protein